MSIRIVSEDVVIRRIGEEYFLLTTSDATLHNIRGTGVFIFEAVLNGAGYDEILDGLVSEYEVERDEAARDMDGFLRELEEKGILEIRD